MKNVIVNCEIVEGQYKNTIMVELTDGSIEDLYSYYWDELNFSRRDFIGKTEDEARAYCHLKDVSYLRR